MGRSGLVGIGAFLSEETARNMLAELKSKKNVVLPKSFMTMTFGPGAFFGTTLDLVRLESPPSKDVGEVRDLNRALPIAGWWSTFPMEPAPTSKTAFNEVKDRVLEKHRGWTPLIVAMIEKSGLGGAEKTFVLPRWITPPLPKWTSESGRIVLAGDAAHCMPPDSGQGVSCAVEDAMTIGLLCEAMFTGKGAEDGKSDEEKLKRLCELYTKLRKPRCEFIVAEARKRGDMKREMSVVEQTIRNVVMWAMCKVMPESTMDAFYSYDVEVEVKKALRGETPSAKGKGKVVTKDGSGN